jgi:DNA-binding transcriptional ArsR family regulator
MKKSKADLILHPVRMKIIQLLATGKPYTSQQIGELLSDVPQATLYRHIHMLATAGLLKVVETKQVRGTLEKVFALADEGGNISQDDLKNATRDDHLRYFMSFLASLIGGFDRYLEQDRLDFLKDGVGYRQSQFYLDDDEFGEFLQAMRAPFEKAAKNEPRPGRRLRSVSTIFIPEPGKSGDLTAGDKGLNLKP